MVKDLYSNITVSKLLRNIAAAHLLKGDNRFRIIAYEKAADAIEHLSREIRDIWTEGRLDEVPGIGSGIGRALDEYFKKGTSSHFDYVFKGIPPTVFILMQVPGLGPKRAFRLVKEFGLTDTLTLIDDLKSVAKSGKIAALEGFGQKSQDDIFEGLLVFEKKDRMETRMPYPYARDLASQVIKYVLEHKGVEKCQALGSLRRCVVTIGDIDIVAVVKTGVKPEEIVKHFLEYPGKRSVEGAGQQKASIIAAGNIRIDLRVQENETYGSMLQYFTGSKAHNIKLREYALKKGLSLSEYGIKNVKTGKVKKYETEKEFYGALGLTEIPPEIREGTEEIRLSENKALPVLILNNEIKGDVHIHTNYDIMTSHDLGLNSFEEHIKIGKDKGYEYIGFSEHNPKQTDNSIENIVAIMKARKDVIDNIITTTGYPCFIGLEVDILPSGELALPEAAHKYVDYIIASVHSSFNQSRVEMTQRVMKALSYQKVRIFGHPTARLLEKRDGIDVDWKAIFKHCAERSIALEINASPSRLDLPDTLVREGKNYGSKYIINTDSHAVEHMDFMPYGVSVARRGWLTSREVVNTYSLPEFRSWLMKT